MTGGTSVGLVVVAAGRGKRFGGHKQFVRAGGRPLLWHSLSLFDGRDWIRDRVVVLPGEMCESKMWFDVRDALEAPHRAIAGGKERADSVRSGLLALDAMCEIVIVHDGARPFPPLDATMRAIDMLKQDPELAGVVVGSAVTDTIKAIARDGLTIERTIDRQRTGRAETPQVCRRDLLTEALGVAGASLFTDEAQALEYHGHRTAFIKHTGYNLKVTAPEDLIAVEAMLADTTGILSREDPDPEPETVRIPPLETGVPFSVGFGYDVHAFADERKLFLGGVEIPSDRGLLGHSDADVLLHAICDAILGAAGLPDIGHYFPNKDPRWKGASSRVLLREVRRLAREAGWQASNVDATVVAEAPRVGPYRDDMKSAIAEDLGLHPSRIAIKATTNERMGFVGREEGIAAMATVLLARATR